MGWADINFRQHGRSSPVPNQWALPGGGELYFSTRLWPDFDRQEFFRALLDFQARRREESTREDAARPVDVTPV
ncbi:MAG: hypothetical protein U5S82_00420 [Gammaproteobacteria bacterium]|nr:hypothetical protein [Gammaproteobacteria bacterium]